LTDTDTDPYTYTDIDPYSGAAGFWHARPAIGRAAAGEVAQLQVNISFIGIRMQVDR